VTGRSPLIISFPLSTTVGGGLGTVGLTKTVLEWNVRGRSYIPESSLVCWAFLD
jgi:hypothetical protein